MQILSILFGKHLLGIEVMKPAERHHTLADPRTKQMMRQIRASLVERGDRENLGRGIMVAIHKARKNVGHPRRIEVALAQLRNRPFIDRALRNNKAFKLIFVGHWVTLSPDRIPYVSPMVGAGA